MYKEKIFQAFKKQSIKLNKRQVDAVTDILKESSGGSAIEEITDGNYDEVRGRTYYVLGKIGYDYSEGTKERGYMVLYAHGDYGTVRLPLRYLAHFIHSGVPINLRQEDYALSGGTHPYVLTTPLKTPFRYQDWTVQLYYFGTNWDDVSKILMSAVNPYGNRCTFKYYSDDRLSCLGDLFSGDEEEG